MENHDEKDPRTHVIIGAAMEVHSELGPGFLEQVYGDALAVELRQRNILFHREIEIPICYKGLQLPSVYRADFLCFDSVIVELKAIKIMSASEESQIIHYLKATGHEIGLLLNFATPSLQFRRFIHSR